MKQQFTSNKVRKFHVGMLLVLIGCLTTMKLQAQSPGGISSGLAGWWKANQGATTTTWADASGKGRNAKQGSGFTGVTINPNIANYNPAYVMGSNTVWYYDPKPIYPQGVGYNKMTVFGVGLTPAGKRTTFWGEVGGSCSRSLLMKNDNDYIYFDAPYSHQISKQNTISNRTQILLGKRDDKLGWLYQDGLQVASATNFNNLACYSGTNETSYYNRLFASWDNYHSTDGNISEIIVYTTALTDAQMAQVQSYLAIKYGITLDASVGDYLASDGSVIYARGGSLFPYTTYINNIAGVGRDDGSGLEQRQSTSNIVGIPQLIISNDELGVSTSNSNNNGNFSADLSFLVWGDDGGAMAQQSNDVPALYSGSKRLSREWMAQSVNHGSDAVTLQIDLNSALDAGVNASRLKLMIDTDGNGNFTDGDIVYVDCSSLSGGIATFNNVQFPDGVTTFTILTSALKGGLTLGDCSTSTVVSSASSAAGIKKLYANNTNQTAFLKVPIKTNLTGPITVKISGDPTITLNGTSPYQTTLITNQNFIYIPIKYNGTGTASTRSIIIETPNSGSDITSLTTATCNAPVPINLPPSTFTLNCTGAIFSPANYTQNTSKKGFIRVNLGSATAGTDTLKISSSPVGFSIDPAASGYVSGVPGQSVVITAGQTSIDIPIEFTGTTSGLHTITISDTHGASCTTTNTVLAPKAVYNFGDCSTATITPGTTDSPLKADGTNQITSMVIPITVTTPGLDTLQLTGTGFTPTSYPVNLTAGQTSITIPLTFNGSNADVPADPSDPTPQGTTPINVASLIAGNACDVTAFIEAKSAVVQSMDCVGATQSGSFTANGVTGQIGYIMMPVTVTEAGYIHFTLSGDSRFKMSPSPQTVIAPAGTNILKIKVIYNGASQAGTANVTLSAKEILGTTCPVTLTIDNTVGEFTMNCNGNVLTVTPATGSDFYNDGSNQNGTIAIPITVTKAGNVTFTLSGSTNMKTNPSPYSTSVTVGQTTLNIPVIYNGAGAADVVQTVQINSAMASQGACSANYTPIVRAGTFKWGNCSNSTVTYPTTLGGFQANNTTQTGSMQIPITNATAGPVSLSLTSPGFTTNPNPFVVTLTAGQTVINVPFTYDGTGQSGGRVLTATSTNATNNSTAPCSPQVNIVSDQGIITFGNCSAATSTGYLVANTTPLQEGTITLPITASKSGPVTFNLTGTNFVMKENPFVRDVVAGVTTSVTIPFYYDGLGAASFRTLTVTSPTNNGSSSCLPTIKVWSAYASYSLSCGSSVISAVATLGKFQAGGGVGQTGTITIPINVTQNGSASFYVVGSGFNSNPVPFITDLTVGQTSVSIPVVYDGSGVGRTQQLAVTQSPGSQSCTNITANVVGVTTPIVVSNPNPIVAGQQTTFTMTGCDSPGIISWYNNGVLISGATNSTLVVIPAVGDSYTAICTVNGVPSSPSTPVTVPPLAPTVTTSPNPVVANQQTTFTSTGCNAPGVVSWYRNGVLISGATNSQYVVIPSAGESYTSVCTVNGVSSAQSTPVIVPQEGPVITTNPNPIVAGQPTTFTATGCAGTVSWYKNGVLISGANLSTYGPVTVQSGESYTSVCTVNGVPSSPSTPVIIPSATSSSLSMKVFLQGPLSGTSMTTILSTPPQQQPGAQILLPTSDPYGKGAIATNTTLVTDWVLVELRNGTNGSNIVESVAALLSSDGTIRNPDGTTPLKFVTTSGNYYVAVRHRNHLGVMTQSPVAISSTAQSIDFTSPSTPTFGTNAQKVVGSVMAMWAGNATGINSASPDKVSYTGLGSDLSALKNVIGSNLTQSISGYLNADLNLDGRVNYTGLGTDLSVLKGVLNQVPGNVLGLTYTLTQTF
ncbi:hypothetical protein Emtol_3010 [Emticicia oligotrophica DSM 17448]|uniref:DUF8202 domain-containing protein n=1 Tax=Emticicia oligotrophica (strain DSM 17448 / CIP 109782 / MTCC 6937 / GPTSA100-15) TaxID=929562 RepID=A0ABN4APL6_EMTOG|nr:hypothetical protein [Emticicia oligotrophica]AFK04143.1 hypothetical protein Emtol_3010 [Emticicia oligotrophica DSM 17448]